MYYRNANILLIISYWTAHVAIERSAGGVSGLNGVHVTALAKYSHNSPHSIKHMHKVT